MGDIDVSKEGLEVCSWGWIYYDENQKGWILAIDEGEELDAALLMANDILEDYQIPMIISNIKQRDFSSGKSSEDMFKRMFK